MTRRRLPLVALFTADAISVTGNILALVAIPWFVLELTGSPALAGVTAFFSALASVLAAFFGGVLVDRVGFRRMSVLADIASAAAIGVFEPMTAALTGIIARTRTSSVVLWTSCWLIMTCRWRSSYW